MTAALDLRVRVVLPPEGSEDARTAQQADLLFRVRELEAAERSSGLRVELPRRSRAGGLSPGDLAIHGLDLAALGMLWRILRLWLEHHRASAIELESAHGTLRITHATQDEAITAWQKLSEAQPHPTSEPDSSVEDR